jgi:predicted P-loop ATPase
MNLRFADVYKMLERAQIARLRLDHERERQEKQQRELVRQRALAASAALEPPDVALALIPPPPDGPEWTDGLTKGPGGAVAQTLHNARTILRNHEDFRGLIRWNEVTKKVEVTGGPMRQYSRFGTENVVAGIVDHLSSAHGVNVNHKDLGRRVYAVARERPYDPVREHLLSLRWDGVPRLDTWLSVYCGAVEDDENRRFLRLVGRRWPISLVARGLDPGCKVDNVLVLKGPGGLGKSTVFEILGGEWFCDTAINLGDKDSRMMASRYWLCELAECVAFKRSGSDVLKNFFSSRSDKFRPPYGSEIEEFPRRCVFVGTLNEDMFLTDETGNRKYYVVEVIYTPEALNMLRRDRDQLLAEAVAAWRAGEKWYFGYEEISITEAQNEKYMVETAAKSKVASWWYGMHKSERPRDMTTLEVWEMAFDASAVQNKDNDMMRIGHALAKMGFAKSRDSTPPRLWRWYPTEMLLNAERVETRKRVLFAIQGGKKKDESK